MLSLLVALLLAVPSRADSPEETPGVPEMSWPDTAHGTPPSWAGKAFRHPITGNPGANDVAPNKRPRSSMSPSILLKDGVPIAAFGSPGGATIINSVFQIVLDLIDHGMTIQEAIDAPRISVTSATGAVSREAGFADAVIQALRSLGHSVGSPGSIGSVQGVVVDLQTGKQYGGADRRREGTVIGLPRPRGE